MMIIHFITSLPPYSEKETKEAILEAIQHVRNGAGVKNRMNRRED